MARPRTVTPVALLVLAACQGPGDPGTAASSQRPSPQRVAIPGSAVVVDLVADPVDAGWLWVATTETTWDAFDLFLYGGDTDGVDGIARPTIPYISMDRGFGHEGYPVLSISPKAARAYCAWLSAVTDRVFRLPSLAEWRKAAGDTDGDLDAMAWHALNSGGRTHPPAQKRPNAHGLYDVFGNAGEWCTDADGRPVLAGGSYKDRPSAIAAGSVLRPVPAWNASDPQVPSSVWWYADAGFTGLRVVCEDPAAP